MKRVWLAAALLFILWVALAVRNDEACTSNNDPDCVNGVEVAR